MQKICSPTEDCCVKVANMFENNIDNIKILAVLDLEWQSDDGYASPRPFHALSFRVKGNAHITTNKQKLHLQSKDIIFMPKGLGYHLNAKSERVFCIHFDTDTVLPDEIVKISPSNSVVIENIFSSVFESWLKKKPGYYNDVVSGFYKILSKIESQSSETSDAMSDVIDYIHEHFTEPSLSLDRLLDISLMSESKFRKEFKEKFGTTPVKYINSLRTRYALELIQSGYYKIYQISEMAGFNDPKYFSKFMKKNTDLSPAELKKLNIREN